MLTRLQREKGQGLVEYALILIFVALAVIVILALLGPAVGNVFSNLIAQI
jgi:pilus assembly protein Flp/PilA